MFQIVCGKAIRQQSPKIKTIQSLIKTERHRQVVPCNKLKTFKHDKQVTCNCNDSYSKPNLNQEIVEASHVCARTESISKHYKTKGKNLSKR